MKKAVSVLLLLSFLSTSFSAAQPASLLGEEILSDLLVLNLQIENLQQQLERLERNWTEREQLLRELETASQRKEELLKKLSTLVEEQAKDYMESLRKWKFLTVLLGSLSAALTGVVIYQGVSR